MVDRPLLQLSSPPWKFTTYGRMNEIRDSDLRCEDLRSTTGNHDIALAVACTHLEKRIPRQENEPAIDENTNGSMPVSSSSDCVSSRINVLLWFFYCVGVDWSWQDVDRAIEISDGGMSTIYMSKALASIGRSWIASCKLLVSLSFLQLLWTLRWLRKFLLQILTV